eukprot:TRINITY_DN66127_c3_g2_i10.p1 TRINITY_DN66127_c3_g2~~TRINITY_DN66127_c3_g2_i10.p1  ORF type:complete len:276 (+),score=62.14 TRINITY_DN66127_c3_g2_i10:63-890(+)
MPNVEVLSLSVNKIASLKDFAYCTNLKELYLRKNEVHDLDEVRFLRDLRELKILWLCDNPCAESAIYRTYVIRTLQFLEKLDNIDITPQERAMAMRMDEGEINRHMNGAGGARRPKQAPPQQQQQQPQPVRQQEVIENVRSRWQKPAEHPLERGVPVADEYGGGGGGGGMMGGGGGAPPASHHHHQPPPQTRPPQQQQHQPPHQHQHQHQPQHQQHHQPAHQPPPQTKPKPKSNKSSSSQKNILAAVLSLINEFNMESMEILHQELTERLQQANR